MTHHNLSLFGLMIGIFLLCVGLILGAQLIAMIIEALAFAKSQGWIPT